MKRGLISRLAGLSALLAAAACSAGSDPQGVRAAGPLPPPQPTLAPALAPVALEGVTRPVGRLPADVRPTHVALALTIDPEKPTFQGAAEITVELDQPRDLVWLHGRDLRPSRVTIAAGGAPPVEALWDQVTPAGLVALRPRGKVGPGKAVIHVEYEATLGESQEGLFRVTKAGTRYVFSQFEATYARRAFPAFDEPAFKVPYDVTLVVPRGAEAISNGAATSRSEAPGGRDRVTFATTEKLPSYLLAFAVGPFDVVDGPVIPASAIRPRAVPLRGITARGRGPGMAFALAHTGAVIGALENYLGVAYPYAKLDLIAVPEKRGAMENAGAVTFGETTILLDPRTATVADEQNLISIDAHELAHQWFGDLVTMPWWDDLWLNEAFATWMGRRITGELRPEYRSPLRALEATHGAMAEDVLASARAIRQPITGDDDIANAFDGITYQKGAAVLDMFEQHVGPKVWQAGLHAYLEQHRHGNATATDLIQAISTAAGRDVTAPFQSFLSQRGVPLVEATLSCEAQPALVLHQSAFLPAGVKSSETPLWKIPFCARYAAGAEVKTACTLLAEREAKLPLDAATCPAWVMPNAGGAGYYRWSLPSDGMKQLASRGYAALSPAERLSFAESVRSGALNGRIPMRDALAALPLFASDPSRAVAEVPMALLREGREHLDGDAAATRAFEAFAGGLYAATKKDLGWEAAKGAVEDGDRSLLRRDLLGFLAWTARDPALRREANERGRAYLGSDRDHALHPEAVDRQLAGTALAVAAAEGDAAFFDALLAQLGQPETEALRDRILGALAAVTRPELSARALALTLDPRLRSNEILAPLYGQLARPETRDAAWAWLEAHVDAVLARMPPGRASRLAWVGLAFCDAAHAEAIERVFTERAKRLDGGPRDTASAVESVRLCAARRGAAGPALRAIFGGAKAPAAPRKGGSAPLKRQ